jgi:outer membrane protein assembly factor BamB
MTGGLRMRRRGILFLSLLCSACVSSSAGTDESAAEWPTFHGNPGLTGAAGGALPTEREELWRVKVGSSVDTTPVAGGGLLYASAGNGKLVALDPAGQEKWSRTIAGAAEEQKPRPESFAAPLLYARELLIAAARSGKVYALDAKTGKSRWTYDAGENIQGTPNVHVSKGKPDRILVLTQPDGALHCIDATKGKALWTTEGPARTDSHISVARGRIVFGSCDTAVHAVSVEDGSEMASVTLGEGSEIAGGIAVPGDLAFTGNRSGALVCVDLGRREIVWNHAAGSGELFTTPAVGKNRVVVVSGDGNVVCLDRKAGKKLWAHAAGAMVPKAPVIAGDLVVASLDGTLAILKLQDGSKAWSHDISDEITSPAIVGDLIVVGSDEGQLHAFGRKKKTEGEGRAKDGGAKGKPTGDR